MTLTRRVQELLNSYRSQLENSRRRIHRYEAQERVLEQIISDLETLLQETRSRSSDDRAYPEQADPGTGEMGQ